MTSIPDNFIEVIANNLHNLVVLSLDEVYGYAPLIECLITGCPKLKVLHVDEKATLESVQAVLLGLPHLVEFKYPSMVVALERIIRDGKAGGVTNLRNLYISEKGTYSCKIDHLKSAEFVMEHFSNITKFEMDRCSSRCKVNLATFPTSKTVSKLKCLTNLAMWESTDFYNDIVPVIKTVGYQLQVLDLDCTSQDNFHVVGDSIMQCKDIRVLRLKLKDASFYSVFSSKYSFKDTEDYGSEIEELKEDYILFPSLQELHLEGFIQAHLKPSLFASLLASPVLEELTLVDVANFTDYIAKAVLNHVTEEGEQLALTSLHKLVLEDCKFITSYLEKIVTHERVPLKYLEIINCCNVTELSLWNLEKFELDFAFVSASIHGSDEYEFDGDDFSNLFL